MALEQSDDSPECWTLQGAQVLGLHFSYRDEGQSLPKSGAHCRSLSCLTDVLQLIFSSINLMKQLISSSNLFVLQVEMDVYTALKKVLAWGSVQWNLCGNN